MRKKFSTNWKSSKKPRKQRKYIYNAPLHIRRKFLSAHLSRELKKKYGKRNITTRKGDKVKIMRGRFKGHIGTVEHLDLKNRRVRVSGAEFAKVDGTKVPLLMDPSNLMIIELNLNDKKRRETLEQRK